MLARSRRPAFARPFALLRISLALKYGYGRDIAFKLNCCGAKPTTCS